MNKLSVIFLFILVVLGTGASSSLALQNTPTTSYDGLPIVQKITIRGIVPYMRVIYVDSKDNVTKVVGNTDRNIPPTVITAASNNQIKLTQFIQSQYQKILDLNNGHLQAGKTYYPAPDKLSLEPKLLKLSSIRLPVF